MDLYATVSLSIWSVAGDVLNERVSVGHMWKAAMKAVVHPSTFKAIPDTFLKNNDLIAPIAMFMSNHAEKGSNCVKRKKKLSGLKLSFKSFLHYLQRLTALDDDDLPPGNGKKRCSCSDEKSSNKLSSSTSVFHDSVWSVTSRGKSKEANDFWSLSIVRKQKKDCAPRPNVVLRPT